MKDSIVAFAERLMRCPAAPYHEDLVATEVIRICNEFGLSWRSDSFGNLIVTAVKWTGKTPFVLAAHMDHPGFHIRRRISRRACSAEFLGGVGDSYFIPGTRVRLMPGSIPATLGKRTSATKRIFEIETTEDLKSKPKFAVWDLPEIEQAGDLLRGRVCDDLIGCATILAVLISLRKARVASNVIGVLSRAEEVGFHGALTLAKSKLLPKKSLIISLETSRELPPVKMGHGVIIRVGDRASTFDSAATRFLTEVAGDLTKRDSGFRFQRALMSGGTCEATAYQEYGYRCAAVCVALGNYHNCGDNNLVASEFVNASDADAMAHLLAECARVWDRFDHYPARLVNRLERLSKEAHRHLRKRPLNLVD